MIELVDDLIAAQIKVAVVSNSEGRLAELSIAPARAGLNTMTVRFRDAQGRAFDPRRSKSLPPMRRPAWSRR